MSTENRTGRLSTLQAAYVVARRDFVAILFSRSFFFFLLGPLFPILVGGLAGGIGAKVQESTDRPVLGIAMQADDAARMVAAQKLLAPQLGPSMPDVLVVKELKSGETFDPQAAMKSNKANLAAIVSGTPKAPVLTGSAERIGHWQGRVAMLSAQASGTAPSTFPQVKLAGIAATTRADQT
ncbi:MAG: hypothetical protein RL299_806, partial [Pseudomonadota bacterium]